MIQALETAGTIHRPISTISSSKAKQKVNEGLQADLLSFPESTQLLLAYCLEQNNPHLFLLNGDDDAEPPRLLGWLREEPSPTMGTREYSISPTVWRQLRKLNPFGSHDLHAKLDSYRRAKSACYPWVW